MIRIEGLGDRVSRAALDVPRTPRPASRGQKRLHQTAAQCFKGKCPRKEHALLAEVKTIKLCGTLSTARFQRWIPQGQAGGCAFCGSPQKWAFPHPQTGLEIR